MAAARFLLRAQLAATEADIMAVRTQGAEAWLEAQFAVPIGEKSWDWLERTGRLVINEEYRFYRSAALIEYAMAHQLIALPDHVRKRMALALSEFFVVSAAGFMFDWPSFVIAAYWDALNTHAFGNFRQLFEAITLSPAMGIYLNTLGNQKEDAATGRVPDENYAREVMQLFTLGLVQLNLDGTARRDTNGNTLPTYTQDDVTQLARVFTGYVLAPGLGLLFTDSSGNQASDPQPLRQPMAFQAWRHSNLAASFLGTTIPANTPGPTALGIALDTLFNHPNVGPFFARQMIQRLVTGNPSPAYVARVAAKFNDNGLGVRGDLKAVWKAILLDDESLGGAGLMSTTFGKVREPMIRVYQWAGTFKVTSARGTWKWTQDQSLDKAFGQRPLHPPSVFNFFRPGYVPPGTAMAASGASAPEFQILNESSVSQWINLIELYAINGLAVTYPDRPGFPASATQPFPTENDIRPDYSAEIALLADLPALIRRLNLLLCAGQLSTETQQKILDILTVTPVNLDSMTLQAKFSRVGAAVTLVMCCADYLVQK